MWDKAAGPSFRLAALPAELEANTSRSWVGLLFQCTGLV